MEVILDRTNSDRITIISKCKGVLCDIYKDKCYECPVSWEDFIGDDHCSFDIVIEKLEKLKEE